MNIIHFTYTHDWRNTSTEFINPTSDIELHDAPPDLTKRCQMNTLSSNMTHPRSSAFLSARSLGSALRRAAAIAHQRRALIALDDALLRDIGLTRSEALREARRPFWDAPQHWRR